ncbi:hypothetical protein AbraIFM66951_007306 [Aspergillus brasiliensis]|uniref:Heterokaryon incompatibility domain-containing protein n=1 Tax=Aspergillus brasiliensis TaxID=319629 RepID=A0A9W5YQ88_9EURO|nr:hypothetical protein AbraCBS73388_007851 [Aspergillus brasiliensis]GKZ44961.1 hypothetical protein AbraIFM66951_007306 [Aspergillus brasiliensis]
MQTDLELGHIHGHAPGGSSTVSLVSGSIATDLEKPDWFAKSPRYYEIYLNPSSYSKTDYATYLPGRKYKSIKKYRHKDSLGRVWIGRENDQYLSATDGRLVELVVQASEEICHGPANSTWARRKLEESTPMILRVVYSLMERQLQNNQDAWSRVIMCLEWLPSCVTIAGLLFLPTDLGGELRNNGHYEQFKYHYWGYSTTPANLHEVEPSSTNHLPGPRQFANGVSKRPLRPRRLCLLQDDGGIAIVNVEEWEAVHGSLEYLFICYTTEQYSHESNEDMDELHRIAGAAARTAGVAAYWIACSCMPDDDDQWEDVYRISDVVRGAQALVVIIGPSPGLSRDEGEMLRHLGSRLWTFPEVLLSPSGQPISIYKRDCPPDSFRVLSKRNFAIEAWGDATVSRELIDHYEGSIILSPLELVSIALQCFPNRETTTYYNGDLSYALMGLLRRRPRVNPNDSAFEAFCRLSWANDSDRLLERLVCMLPRNIDQPWYEINDFWDSHLWDIEPLCQVVGFGGNDTVIMSGAFGAPIRWASFEPVNMLMRETAKRLVARVVLRSTPVWIVTGVISLAISQSRKGAFLAPTVIGWVFTGLYILVTLASPYLISILYVGKTWASQAWLFGFEGYMAIGEIEKLVFGINLGRLKWSPYSSDLSLHVSQNGECVGKDPTCRESTAQFVSAAQNSRYGELKIFTLVDTNTLTVTLFRARRPPVAMLLCGSEGGMQRALLCSYDWKSQTLYRESVLRVDTLVLDKMSRIDRFRLGLNRPMAETVRVAC